MYKIHSNNSSTFSSNYLMQLKFYCYAHRSWVFSETFHTITGNCSLATFPLFSLMLAGLSITIELILSWQPYRTSGFLQYTVPLLFLRTTFITHQDFPDHGTIIFLLGPPSYLRSFLFCHSVLQYLTSKDSQTRGAGFVEITKYLFVI